jgi:hypothetical protein
MKGEGLYEINSQLDWIVSYPKSGNTWVKLMLLSYYEGEIAHYADSSLLFYQAVSPYPIGALTPYQEIQIRGAAMFYLACSANNNQTLIKSHHAFGEMRGVDLFPLAFVRRAIYVMRDPRDVACSMTRHLGKTYEEAVEFMNRQAYLGGAPHVRHFINNWSQHIHSWTNQNKVPTIIIRYEDLHTDPAKELREIVAFLDWEVDEDRIQAAVEANTFDKLQADERKNGFQEARKHGPFFRRGIVGAWRDELTPELVQAIEENHADEMRAQRYEPELIEAVA